MIGLIIYLLAYAALLKITRNYQINYMKVNNITQEEYDKIIEKKMKGNITPFEFGELNFVL